jgi:hypothetical protein
MGFYRVEIERGGEWHLVLGKVETRDEAAAVDYVRQVLPKRTEGHKLRAMPVKKHRVTMQPAVAATEVHDG